MSRIAILLGRRKKELALFAYCLLICFFILTPIFGLTLLETAIAACFTALIFAIPGFFKLRIRVQFVLSLLVIGALAFLTLFVSWLLPTIALLHRFVFRALLLFLFSVIQIILFFLYRALSAKPGIHMTLTLCATIAASMLQPDLGGAAVAFAILLVAGLATRFFIFPPKRYPRAAIPLFIVLVLLVMSLAFYATLMQKTQNETGLLQRNLLYFGFNDKLTIQSEYSFSRELLFFAKLDRTKLLKATVYPYYTQEEGFFNGGRQFLTYPRLLPDSSWRLPDPTKIDGAERRKKFTALIYNIALEQDFMFGAHEVYELIPFEKDPESPFANVFEEHSLTYDAGIPLNATFDKLSPSEKELYTRTNLTDKEMIDFLEKFRPEIQSPVMAIPYFYFWFRNNNFLYSLTSSKDSGFKGIKTFLMKTKKGYCSHYAYSYALMLRYYGVPCQVVGGFMPMTDNKILDFFKFYDFNAHTWVEVWTDQLGWIDIDPTVDKKADDEVLPFQMPNSGSESKYLEYLLKSQNTLKPKKKPPLVNKNDVTPETQPAPLPLPPVWLVVFIIAVIALCWFFRMWLLFFALSFHARGAQYLSIILYRSLIRKSGRTFETLEEFRRSDPDLETKLAPFAATYYSIHFARVPAGRFTRKAFLSYLAGMKRIGEMHNASVKK